MYRTVSNEFAHVIMKTIRMYTDKNEIQKEYKNIMHKIDVKCFGKNTKKVKVQLTKMGKYKHKAVKDLSDKVKEHKKNRIHCSGKN